MQYLTLGSEEKEADIEGVKHCLAASETERVWDTERDVDIDFKIPSFLFLWGVMTQCVKNLWHC